MNIEDYREYCLSLGDDVEEKLPFTAFHHASGVLVFYVHGHMFSFFDCEGLFAHAEMGENVVECLLRRNHAFACDFCKIGKNKAEVFGKKVTANL